MNSLNRMRGQLNARLGLSSMTQASLQIRKRRAWLFVVLLTGVCVTAFAFSHISSQATDRGAAQADSCATCPPEVRAFRERVGGPVKGVIVELHGQPVALRKVAAERAGRPLSMRDIVAQSMHLRGEQDAFLSSLEGRDVRAMARETVVQQPDGSMRRIEYRFSYLLHGFAAYVAEEDIERLRALPEVAYVTEARPVRYFLDQAIDYSLGTQPTIAARRTAVYGAQQQFQPAGEANHPEAPFLTRNASNLDGYEGQGINIAIIDSGVDWRHPMFGGTGLNTPMPRISGNAENPAADNRKVIYYYALSSPGNPTDDFGHGTLVASSAAGYSVDGSTPRNPGYGTGPLPNSTGGVGGVVGAPGTGIGPTPNGQQFFGTAPQARIMAYKVCGPAPQCAGDIELAMEDAASPFTLVASGDTGPTPVAKPVADVINLSLGDESGDPAGASARAANNAALAGTIIVASAGNSGPGPGTIGSPSAATLAISVAASLDPGSVAGADVLLPNQVPTDLRLPGSPGPVPERDDQPGDPSSANLPNTAERQGMKIFPVAGGGPIPGGSLSAHYVFVDLRPAGSTPPPSVTNRIAVVKFTGTFAAAANQIAALNPAAILLITAVESATAATVVNGIPTFTISVDDGNYLIDRISNSDTGDGDDTVDVPNGTISQFPLRLGESISLGAFVPQMAGFSSRGPNDHPNARFRTIKPDVTAPGVGIAGAATPSGLPDSTLGLASPTGYTTANGTSFSGPITAGAMVLVRQRVREELGLDSTNTTAADYNSRRFDTVTVARALLQNTATNLRSGLGVPESDPAATATINDMGSGHINIAGALAARAIMVSPTVLINNEEIQEFTPRDETPPAGNNKPVAIAQASPTPFTVLIPSASFGAVPVVGVDATVVRTREVIIRDLPGSGGDGTYNLSFQNNRNATDAGFQVTIVATAASTTPITSITVPAGGQASFFVRVAANGAQVNVDDREYQFYISAAKTGEERLRMPFYYRATRANIPNIAAPDQAPVENTEQPAPAGSDCVVDTNGNYRLRFSYTAPDGGPAPVGFRVQEATRSMEVFFDNADEPLAGGANSKFTNPGTPPQWTSQTNPDTGSLAYYIPDTAEQNESLVMNTAVALPPGGATLSFTTNHDFEDGFDNGFVEVSTDDGASFVPVGTLSNDFSGTRSFDLSQFAGQSVRIRFRMVSDLLNGEQDPAPLGWYVEDILLSSDDFRTIADLGAGATTFDVTGRSNGTYFYRIAGRFSTPDGVVTGPYSNTRCVTVTGVVSFQFSSAAYTVPENDREATITVTRTGGDTSGAGSVAYATSNGTATAGQDYVAVSGTLNFAPGETAKTFIVPILNDTEVEGDETVNLTLSNPMGGVLGVPSNAVLTITDNDTAGTAQRTFISITGSDANSCTATAPCRTFVAALLRTREGGELIVLTSGDYDSFTINKSVTISAPTSAHAGITSTSGVAVTVNAGTANTIVLRGLALNGLGGATGILHQRGGALHIEDSTINGFTAHGIDFAAPGELFVTNTTLRSNATGIRVQSSAALASASIDRTRLEGNGEGLVAGNNSAVTARDSYVVGNSGTGLRATTTAAGMTAQLTIENALVNGNATGIASDGAGTATVRVARTTVAYNGVGLMAAGGGNSLISRGNNTVEANTVDGSFTATAPPQ